MKALKEFNEVLMGKRGATGDENFKAIQQSETIFPKSSLQDKQPNEPSVSARQKAATDYFTKHHCPAHHKIMRPHFLTTAKDVESS